MLKKLTNGQEKNRASNGIDTGTITEEIFGAVQDKADGYESSVSNGNIYKRVIHDTDDEAKFQLRKEQLDISKKLIQTGEVTFHKEVLIEKKNITVPVTHVELVIEKKISDTEATNKMGGNIKTIRIPLSEEQVEVIKHSVVLEDVSVYKRQFKDAECVEETLKSEKLHVGTIGELEVIDKESGHS